MKHKKVFNSFVDSFLNKKNISVSVDSFSIVPFVASLIQNKRRVFLCEDPFFDDIYSSFPDHCDVVGLPQVQYKKIGSFYSYHEQLFQRAVGQISGNWKGVKTCVFDKKNINKPLFSKKNSPAFCSTSNSFSYDSLLVYLRENKYRRVSSILKEGEYVLRGFVVDVYSHGEKKPFRFNFFDTPCLFYLIGLDGNVLKKLDEVVLLPPPARGRLSLVDFFDEDCVFVEYVFSEKKLYFSDNFFFSGDFLQLKDPFLSFDYKAYSGLEKNKKISSSSWLLSSAASYKDVVISPSWFEKNPPEEAPGFVEEKLKLIEKDYYVHSSFGVCMFLGFEENSSNKDRACFSFSDGTLKIDIKSLGLISYYSSSALKAPQLSSLHKTGSWLNKKNKALRSAKEYVKNIVDNYALRSSSLKSPCIQRKDLLGLFLSSFKYKDTRDQKQSWQEVLIDLCSKTPMDRLLCGDVGFGKTEIAMRATFTALYNNKSVLVLSPTTILTQQLFECFDKRLSPFGYACYAISRLTKNSNKQIQSFLKAPSSVLIGTHSIAKNPLLLKRAGLFIVDEEHRFGVKDKEFVFNINPTVDYLSMSATPIPRSLQFSLSNIRDISVMLSPPVSRKAIITNILHYDFGVLQNIIFKEIYRGGQVFIVDNSIDNVVFLFNKLRALNGGFSISSLYGSLDKKIIKQTMSDFREKKIDVLIATTIIESGIDVPSANTLIVLNSHLFGLSQLYQLRGRVGRSNKQGYAFLFVPNEKNITKNGIKRLSSLQKNSSLGSGYNVALSDLDIRGPGALFGYSQSGPSLVGFELYTKLLNKAVSLLYPQKNVIDFEKIPLVSLGEDFIPKKYIPFDGERVSVYNFVASCVSKKKLSSFFERCILKFGPPPKEFKNLFLSRKFSLLLYNKDLLSIVLKDGVVSFSFGSLSVVPFDALVVLLDVFFKKRNISYVFKTSEGSFKFQFKNNGKDVYILVQSLIKVLYE